MKKFNVFKIPTSKEADLFLEKENDKSKMTGKASAIICLIKIVQEIKRGNKDIYIDLPPGRGGDYYHGVEEFLQDRLGPAGWRVWIEDHTGYNRVDLRVNTIGYRRDG